MSDIQEKDIVIIGGGIIGCTTAYFLTRHPLYNPSKHRITLLEATKIAGGSSGKAGGLLALWAYPSSIVPLSYQLHAELANEHNGAERWGYRRLHCGQLNAIGKPVDASNGDNTTIANGTSVSLQKREQNGTTKLHAAGLPQDLDWFFPDSIQSYSEMGDPSTTAQVHPFEFTTSMAALAAEKGVKIVTGMVTSINKSAKRVSSVTYTNSSSTEPLTLPATNVILAAGPWTRSLMPTAPISALRAHSVTIRPSRPVSAYAIFTEITLPGSPVPKAAKRHAKTFTPEIYARPNNECYACGEGDTLVPLPPTTADVATDPKRCQDIIDQVSLISRELRDGEVLVRQACYLPNVEGAVAGPLIGETGVEGLLLAAGHTCWGIQNGPATGKLMSEFVFEGGPKSADLGSLDPRLVL